MKLMILAAIAALSFNAFAAYSRIAECSGRTDTNELASVNLFVNKTKDTQGIIAINLPDSGMQVGDTKVDWESNAKGYPRFFDNDYDLDIVINDKSATVDDILVGDTYISQLSCSYQP